MQTRTKIKTKRRTTILKKPHDGSRARLGFVTKTHYPNI